METRHVLVVGADRENLRRVSPMLTDAGFEVHSVGDNELVLDLIQGTTFELLLVAFPTSNVSLSTLLEAIRTHGGPCQRAGVLLLADAKHLDDAQRFVDHGANRAIGSDWGGARLWQVLADLEEVAPRVFVQALVETVDEDGSQERPLLAENLSSTGMLLHGGQSWSPGTMIRFRFSLPGQPKHIEGTAVVVRTSQVSREGVAGCGARFESFKGNSQQRLDSFISQQLG